MLRRVTFLLFLLCFPLLGYSGPRKPLTLRERIYRQLPVVWEQMPGSNPAALAREIQKTLAMRGFTYTEEQVYGSLKLILNRERALSSEERRIPQDLARARFNLGRYRDLDSLRSRVTAELPDAWDRMRERSRKTLSRATWEALQTQGISVSEREVYQVIGSVLAQERRIPAQRRTLPEEILELGQVRDGYRIGSLMSYAREELSAAFEKTRGGSYRDLIDEVHQRLESGGIGATHQQVDGAVGNILSREKALPPMRQGLSSDLLTHRFPRGLQSSPTIQVRVAAELPSAWEQSKERSRAALAKVIRERLARKGVEVTQEQVSGAIGTIIGRERKLPIEAQTQPSDLLRHRFQIGPRSGSLMTLVTELLPFAYARTRDQDRGALNREITQVLQARGVSTSEKQVSDAINNVRYEQRQLPADQRTLSPETIDLLFERRRSPWPDSLGSRVLALLPGAWERARGQDFLALGAEVGSMLIARGIEASELQVRNAIRYAIFLQKKLPVEVQVLPADLLRNHFRAAPDRPRSVQMLVAAELPSVWERMRGQSRAAISTALVERITRAGESVTEDQVKAAVSHAIRRERGLTPGLRTFPEDLLLFDFSANRGAHRDSLAARVRAEFQSLSEQARGEKRDAISIAIHKVLTDRGENVTLSQVRGTSLGDLFEPVTPHLPLLKAYPHEGVHRGLDPTH